MTDESLWITNRFGEKLEAILRKPEGNGPFPAVVFVSGFGMDLHEYINSNDEISKRLVEKDFLTLQFSFAGRGKSEGDYTKMTLERQADQMEDVVAWLKARNDVQPEKISIHATSFGCPTTMTYLARNTSEHNSPVKQSVCMVSGVYDLAQRFATKAKEQRVAVQRNGVTLFFDPFDNEIPVGQHFWKSIDEFDPMEKAAAIKLPILMIHGDKDPYIQTKNARSVFDGLRSNKKLFKSFPNGDHGITDVPRPMREEFLGDVVEWFKQTL